MQPIREWIVKTEKPIRNRENENTVWSEFSRDIQKRGLRKNQKCPKWRQRLGNQD